uniref:Cystatin domain-containing protein n=1 Tax=Eptatretus burgeri TaxID=7764 RepID=A0A8C4R6R8_EPTBU
MKSLCVPMVLSLVLVLLLDQAPSVRADSLSKEQVESAADEALDKLNKQQVSTRKLALAKDQDIQADETDVEGQTNIKFAVVETECNADDPKDWSDCPIAEDKTPIDGQCEVTVLKTEDSLDVGDATCDFNSTKAKKRKRRWGWIKKAWKAVKKGARTVWDKFKNSGIQVRMS